jgi:hypothetical protein
MTRKIATTGTVLTCVALLASTSTAGAQEEQVAGELGPA